MMSGRHAGFASGLIAVAAPAATQVFAVSASPPRFELAAEPAHTVRNVIELENAADVAASYTVATADWTLARDGGVAFSDALAPGSCRPWVALEARTIAVPPRSRYRFRFEVTPPADAAPGECRFAVVFTGADQPIKPTHGGAVAVVGQIGIITYVAVGAVAPHVEVIANDVKPVGGVDTPVLVVRNGGTAHGRLSGVLHGTDANGIRRSFTASLLPVLPGETRMLALEADEPGPASNLLQLDSNRPEAPKPASAPHVTPTAYPLTLKGVLRDGARAFSFAGTFSP